MKQEKGFLLSYTKYGENDAVLCVYTYSEGYKSFFLRGLYSKKNKKKSLLQYLSEIDFCVNSKNSRLNTISNIQLCNHYIEPGNKIGTVQFFIADFLNIILKNEDQNKYIYDGIEEFLIELNTKNFSAHIQFLILLTQNLGISPLLSDEIYLNPEKGIFESSISHHIFDKINSDLWKKILSDGYSTTLSNKDRRNLLESILVYYFIHVAEFRRPISLEVIQQIWE